MPPLNSYQHSPLETANNKLASANETLVSEKASLEEELNALKEFKLGVERQEKEAMINETFYMLSNDIKKDVMENIDTYSLDDIEAKLSVLCVRNKISFGEETPATAPTTYGMAGFDAEDDSIPAWVKAVLETQKHM